MPLIVRECLAGELADWHVHGSIYAEGPCWRSKDVRSLVSHITCNNVKREELRPLCAEGPRRESGVASRAIERGVVASSPRTMRIRPYPSAQCSEELTPDVYEFMRALLLPNFPSSYMKLRDARRTRQTQNPQNSNTNSLNLSLARASFVPVPRGVDKTRRVPKS